MMDQGIVCERRINWYDHLSVFAVVFGTIFAFTQALPFFGIGQHFFGKLRLGGYLGLLLIAVFISIAVQLTRVLANRKLIRIKKADQNYVELIFIRTSTGERHVLLVLGDMRISVIVQDLVRRFEPKRTEYRWYLEVRDNENSSTRRLNPQKTVFEEGLRNNDTVHLVGISRLRAPI